MRMPVDATFLLRSETTYCSEAKQPHIGAQSRPSHVIGINDSLDRFDEGLVELVNLVLGHVNQQLLFIAERQRCFAGNAGPERHAQSFMMGDLGSRADETHVALQHVPELGQLIQLESPEKRADRSDPVVSS